MRVEVMTLGKKTLQVEVEPTGLSRIILSSNGKRTSLSKPILKKVMRMPMSDRTPILVYRGGTLIRRAALGEVRGKAVQQRYVEYVERAARLPEGIALVFDANASYIYKIVKTLVLALGKDVKVVQVSRDLSDLEVLLLATSLSRRRTTFLVTHDKWFIGRDRGNLHVLFLPMGTREDSLERFFGVLAGDSRTVNA